MLDLLPCPHYVTTPLFAIINFIRNCCGPTCKRCRLPTSISLYENVLLLFTICKLMFPFFAHDIQRGVCERLAELENRLEVAITTPVSFVTIYVSITLPFYNILLVEFTVSSVFTGSPALAPGKKRREHPYHSCCDAVCMYVIVQF